MNKRVVILGGGQSGIGAAILAKKQGYEVFLSDKGAISKDFQLILQEKEIVFEEGKHTEDKILNASLIIKSPGIPKKILLIQQIIKKGIEIISEIEFASRYTKVPIIAITGSNGKTTTSSLINHILIKAGLEVGLVGNIGKSFAWHIAEEKKPDYYVAEISSFQLDDVNSFKPYIAIILNITPDHLDEYDYDINLYAKSKWNITKYQTKTDYLILYQEDEILKKLQQEFPTVAEIIPFSLQEKVKFGAYANNKNIIINLQDNLQMTIEELALIGKHNVANSMASATTAKLLNIKNDKIRMGLTDFDTVEHRLESVMKIHGIHFINDSKATNVNAVYYALECMETPVVWIAGGVDKGNDYSEIDHLVEEKVEALICLGKDNSKLVNAFEGKVPSLVETNTIGDAVRSAYMLARKGYTVLLSPACASFDLFKNYEDRGVQFKEEVRKL